MVAIDVDGVLNPDRPATARQLGYQSHKYDGPDPAGQPVSGTVWLHPDHGTWLRELAQRADLLWCTSWEGIASTWIAPRLGLPDDLPWIDLGHGGGIRFGRQIKLAPLYRAVGARPVAVLDDEFGGRDPDEAAERTATGNQTLLVPVDAVTGLQRHHVDLVHRWLDRLVEQVPPQPPGPAKGRPNHRIPWPSSGLDDPEDRAGHEASAHSVGDPVLRKSRLLSRQCDTCIFRPGNLMHLAEGRLHDLVTQTRKDESFIICHDTLPDYRFPEVKPAICRGFADRYSTQALQVLERLFGFIEVDPPHEPASRADAPGAGEPGSTD
ncbi:HAD domain-containing protein [Micromonospora haikouensis]|uniref:HAD domain-containing protein n=1 Tax=Micromonospora haikouensis TaxID=686309 RepID=UPI0037A6F4E3